MADSDENKLDRKSHKRKSKCREKKIDTGNHEPDNRNDRLLRAARRFVQDHGREKRENDGTNLKKIRKHQRESRRSVTRRSRSRSCDSEEDVKADGRSIRQRGATDRCRKRKKHRENEKRSRQFRSDEKHNNNGKEYRQSGGGRRSENDDNNDNDNNSVDYHDDTHKNELKQSGRDENSDRNRHRRKHSRDPKEKRKRKKEKQYSVKQKHETKYSTDTSYYKDTSCYLLNQNTPLNKVALHPIGHIVAHPPEKKIDHEKDYFSFHSHLRLYLYRTSGTFFEDLKASETRSAFAQFCQKYNQGQLEDAYYSDLAKLPIEALQQCKRTRHAWNFKTSNTEQRSLDIIKAGVQKQTDYDVKVIPQGATSQNHRIEGRCRKATITPRLDDLVKKQTEATRKDLARGKEGGMKKEMEQRAMLNMLGLDKIKTGQKITIAPREETG